MNKGFLIVLAIIVAAAGLAAMGAVYTVNQTQQAIVLQFGNPVDIVKEPGLKFKIPFVQNVIYLDKRVLALDAQPEEIIASDQKRLVVDTFARFRITNPLKFYQTVGTVAIAQSRLASIVNSSLRRVLGKVDLKAAVSGERGSLMHKIANYVNEGAKAFGITIVDVRIKRLDLPEANSQAIYRRMQTERQREAKEFRAEGAEQAQTIRAKADRDVTILLADAKGKSEVLRGEGEGAKAKIFADAYSRDKDFFALYRSLQAYREALASGDTTMVLSPDSEFFRYFGHIKGKPGKSQ